MSTGRTQTTRPSLTRWWMGLMLVALGACLAIPALAHAVVPGARFTVEYCDSALPGGNPPLFQLVNPSNAAYAPVQTCAAPGGAVGLTMSQWVTQEPAWVVFRVPPTPGGYVEDETISAFVANIDATNGQSYVFTDGWPTTGGGDIARKFNLRAAPDFQNNGGDFNIVMTCGYSRCRAGGLVAAHYVAATQVDLVPPVLAKPDGSLLAGGVRRGHQTVLSAVSDVGGGVSRIDLLVNGTPAARPVHGGCAVAQVANSSYQGLAAISPSPCPAWLPAGWDLDTAAPPFHDGENTVQLCASDFASPGSPHTTCSESRTVTVNNKCADSPVSGGQVLSATFAASNSETVTVPYGQPADVKGQLANNAGDPISGATICVQAQTEGDPGELAPIATATTDANGQFSYELPAGPNRRLLVGYRHDSFQVGRTISFSSHSKPALRVRPGRVREGGRVKITGSLPGPNAAGRVIVLQASALHGRRWLTFRRATTGPRGGFRATYRFGSTSSTITYRIRAVVPQQSGYPYAAGHSRPARVKVRAGSKHSRRPRKRADTRNGKRGKLGRMHEGNERPNPRFVPYQR